VITEPTAPIHLELVYKQMSVTTTIRNPEAPGVVSHDRLGMWSPHDAERQ